MKVHFFGGAREAGASNPLRCSCKKSSLAMAVQERRAWLYTNGAQGNSIRTFAMPLLLVANQCRLN